MPEMEDGFEVFWWMGQKRYKCNQTWPAGAPCEYDHYDLATINEHVRECPTRMGKPQKQMRLEVSPLVDAEGKPIVHEIPDESLPEEYRTARFR